MTTHVFASGTPPRAGMIQIFSDDFNRTQLKDGINWKTTYPGGLRTLSSTGEKQLYIDENYRSPINSEAIPFEAYTIENSVLALNAKPTPQELLDTVRMPYLSGMINSYDAFQVRYGYIEATAEIPAGKGLWPAFWLRSVDPSHRVEIDIVEMLGQTPGAYNGTVHTPTHQYNVARVKLPDLSQGMHRFGVDWQEDMTTFYVDGMKMGSIATPDALDSPMYMVANLAIGGWAGAPDSKTPWPADFRIDSIKVWQDAAALAPQTLSTGSGNDTLSGGDGNDVLRGNDGQDTIFGANGADFIDGGTGDDRILGGFGNDTIIGSGTDFMIGGMGNDTYIIKDYIARPNEQQEQGFDTVITALNNYVLIGNLEALTYVGSGNFRGTGNIEKNVMNGGIGHDWLAGGRGADRLIGHGGADSINGGADNDTIVGGKGNDLLTGDSGADVFVFAPNLSRDFITDFNLAMDRLDLRTFDLDSFAEVKSHLTTIKGHAAIVAEGTTIILQNVTKGMLQADDFIVA